MNAENELCFISNDDDVSFHPRASSSGSQN